MPYCFLPFQFIFQDSCWVWCIRAKREENDSTSLVRFDSGNIIWEQCRQRQGNGGGRGGLGWWCWKVLNRHQRLNMPFSQWMNILRLPFLSLQQPTKPMFPSAQTSYQSARVFLSRWRMCRTLVCRDRGSCLHVRHTEWNSRVVWIRPRLNVSKVCFFPYHRKRSREEKNQCINSVWS